MTVKCGKGMMTRTTMNKCCGCCNKDEIEDDDNDEDDEPEDEDEEE